MPLTTSRRHSLWYRQVGIIVLCLVSLLSVACGKAKPTPIFPEAEKDTGAEARSRFDNPTERIVSAITTFNAGTDSSQNIQDNTATITPIPMPIGPCTWNADYIGDLNLEDGFLVQPATPIRKVWRLENNGTCPWIEGISLEIVAGNQLHIQPESSVSQTASGMVGDIELAFVSPGKPGTYATYLRMRSPEGGLFGSVVFIKFSVSNTAPLLTDAGITKIPVIPLPRTQEPSPITPTTVPVGPAATEPPATPTQPVIIMTATPVPPATKRATLTPSPTVAPATATNTRIPTVAPSATATDAPTETATVAPSDTPDSGESFSVSPPVETCEAPYYSIDTRLENAKSHADITSLGLDDCASGTARVEDGKYLEFITTPNTGNVSLMLWQSSGTIRIFQGFSKTFGNLMSVRNAGIPLQFPSIDYLAACAESFEDRAPSSFIMPTGNFGYLWCEQDLQNTLGWSLSPEKSVTLIVQEVPNGVLMQVSSSGQRLYDIAINTSTGRGIIQP